MHNFEMQMLFVRLTLCPSKQVGPWKKVPGVLELLAKRKRKLLGIKNRSQVTACCQQPHWRH